MPLDYIFTEGLIDFGRRLASEMVGQPFVVYRLVPSSAGDLIAPAQLFNADLRAKVKHSRTMLAIENDVLKANTFEFLVASEDVAIGDILVQNDAVYGSNSRYAVTGRRPLKPVTAARCEADCYIKRPSASHGQGTDADEYNGSTIDSELPFILRRGEYTVGKPADTASVIPCGITSIAQLKNMKPERLPLDVTTSWWYVFVPYLPGLQRIRENDVVYHINSASALPAAQSATLTGAVAGDTLTLTLDGDTYTNVVVDDSTDAAAVAELVTALNADAQFATDWYATAVGAELTVESVLKGLAANALTFFSITDGIGAFASQGPLFEGGDEDAYVRYRVHIPLVSDAGTAGQFLVCERLTA